MRTLWAGFIAMLVVSFAVLGWVGTRIYQDMPPIPAQVVSTDGRTVIGTGAVARALVRAGGVMAGDNPRDGGAIRLPLGSALGTSKTSKLVAYRHGGRVPPERGDRPDGSGLAWRGNVDVDIKSSQ